MGTYRVTRRYTSRRDGQTFGPWEAGTTIELSDADAEWLERDSPGLLTPEGVNPDGEADPSKDRQHRGGRKRG